MEIYGCTLTEYKEHYEKRLSVYKDKFEDRDESIFLEREMFNFKDFHNVLVSIHNSFIKNKGYNKLINDPQFNNHLNYLQNNYNNVFRELFQTGPPLLDVNKNVSHPDDIKEENVRGYLFYFDITKEKLDNFITSAKRILELINKKQHYEVPLKKKNDHAYKEHIWFKNGLLFAKGKMNKFYNSTKSGFADGYSAPKVSKEIGYENHEKFILATINNYGKDNSNADKNIYNSKDRMEKIIKHCNENDITIDEYFLSSLPIE